MKETITFDDFNLVDIRVGTILEAHDFPQAKKPAFQLMIDFGPLGKLKSSAQITSLYSKEQLVGKQILAVINFPEKQIANMKSQCLILGATNANDVILLKPEKEVPNGSKIS